LKVETDITMLKVGLLKGTTYIVIRQDSILIQSDTGVEITETSQDGNWIVVKPINVEEGRGLSGIQALYQTNPA